MNDRIYLNESNENLKKDIWVNLLWSR